MCGGNRWNGLKKTGKNGAKRRNLTQINAMFAKMIGMQRQNVKKMVFEKRSLDTELLCTISEVLECNIFDYFKSNTDDDTKKTELRATLSIEMGQEKQDKTIRFVFGDNDIEILNK